MNELTEWAQTPTFASDLLDIMLAVQRCMKFATEHNDRNLYNQYSALYERLQAIRSAYRQELAAADWEDQDWALSAIEDTDVTGDYDG